MKQSITFLTVLLIGLSFSGYAQIVTPEVMLAKIRNEGLQNSQAMDMLSELTDVYGQRLTGTREYLASAKWIAKEMKAIGLQDVHFENFCEECRGWGIKTFNVELTSPNFMHIAAYPLAMTKSTSGRVSGEAIHIEKFDHIDSFKRQYGGQLKGQIILLGQEPPKKSLSNNLSTKYTEAELMKMEGQLSTKIKQTPLPELLKSWETEDLKEDPFLRFVEKEGALAILSTRSMYLGVLHPDGTYYYRKDDWMPLPYFTIMPEHFGRLIRMLKQNVTPVVQLNLETYFYHEPENNVNILGEIPGIDPELKAETVMIGAHFDSWHAGTGATDNGANSVVLVEALRILKKIGFTPKRTIKIGLWGGEEQAFLGSVSYGKKHFGPLDQKPNAASTKVSSYLNLDNGAGAIRGIYLQNNEFARPVFEKIFDPVSNLSEGVLSIENTLSTDHETFDHYNIPSFQFIQDPLAYNTVTHHTQLDVLEYVPEEDIKKNAVILAWTIYSLTERNDKVPRKLKK